MLKLVFTLRVVELGFRAALGKSLVMYTRHITTQACKYFLQFALEPSSHEGLVDVFVVVIVCGFSGRAPDSQRLCEELWITRYQTDKRLYGILAMTLCTAYLVVPATYQIYHKTCQ